jgi:hypothetical protein
MLERINAEYAEKYRGKGGVLNDRNDHRLALWPVS